MGNPDQDFENEKTQMVQRQGADESLQKLATTFLVESSKYKYSYGFTWLGRPIIQFPQDIIAMQELVWRVQPDLIIETGIARGGSLILFASLLELNAACGGPADAKVLGVDIDIREHNREAIEAHPLGRRIDMIQGSSIDPTVVDKVCNYASNKKKILVSLDSNHTHEHVLAELNAYARLTSVDSYCVVFDTVVEDMPGGWFANRPWGKGDNPKTAVWEFLKANSNFEIDKNIQNKILITVAPDGYLKRVR